MLAGIEKEYEGRPVVVIGVHSPKFPREGDADAVRDAIRRYSVSHPVVVDTGRMVWDQFAVRAWPTLVVIDPEGYVYAAGSGEPDAEALSSVIDELLSRGAMPASELPLLREPDVGGQLLYPTKVSHDRGHVAITDSGHHRVILGSIKNDALRIAKIIGGPEAGLDDGFAESVRFEHPQGSSFAGDDLYVADTGNHALRRIDLNTGESFTVAGSGRIGRGVSPGGSAFDVELRSPWDVEWDEERGVLYVAMAGAHQIWIFDPGHQLIEPFAGSGREARIDGGPQDAAFAQPSGIALRDGKLYVADSEISAIREIDVKTQQTRTVCGGDLFDFGDRDGVGDRVRLQHVMGISASEAGIWIADSYNHKIKQIDPAADSCTTVFGGEDLLNEPEGLAMLDDGSFLIADTNNHRLVRVSGGTSTVLFE